MLQSCLRCKVRKPGWFCHLSPRSLADFSAISTHTVLPMGNIYSRKGSHHKA